MNEIRTGDALELLGALPSESVHCCVTSPPYWGLRDYGTGAWKGGSPTCEHKKVTNAQRATAGSTLDGGKKTTGHLQEGFGSTCGRCGARRIDRQLGLESMPEEYIANMVGVFREVKRVLRDDGTAWLNLGDSYAASTGQQTITPQTAYATGRAGGNARGPARKTLDYEKADGGFRDYGGLKPKDLVGIPWRVAFALQAAGWWLRSDIIWSKPNPMPESVTDRPTKAHEYIFLLAKSERYYYNAEAIKEPLALGSAERYAYQFGDIKTGTVGHLRQTGEKYARNPPKVNCNLPDGRNARSVWTIATEPFPEAHFATFPTELARRCILAGCPKGGTVLDPFCGAGTTGLVADRLGRSFIGIELKPEYAEMARRRIHDDAPLLAALVAP